MEGNTFRDLLQAIFLIASVPPDNIPAKLNSWLRNKPNAYCGSWTSLLDNDEILNNNFLGGQIIDIMLCNANNDVNPLIKSPAINTFAVKCLLHLPIEVLSRKNRERIMKTWLPDSENVSEGISGQSSAVDAAVLSLKVKVMQISTMYDGMKYQDLVSLAETLATEETCTPEVNLSCFKELVMRTVSHITSNLNQPRNREYILDALSHLRKRLKPKSGDKMAHKLNFAQIALFEILFEAFTIRGTQLNDSDVVSHSDFLSLQDAFQTMLLNQLESVLAKMKKSSKPGKKAERSLMLRSTIDALTTSQVGQEKVARAVAEAKSFAASLKDTDIDLVRRLETFISVFTAYAKDEAVEAQFKGDVSTVNGRQALAETTFDFVKSKDQREKLALLHSSLIKISDWPQLDKLWAVRHLIISCEGSCRSLCGWTKTDSYRLSASIG